MSKVITGLHCTVSAVRGFTRGIVTMPLKFSKELDSYSSKPLAPATSEERRRFSTKINKRISNGIIPRLFKAIGLTLIYPIVSAANDVKKALLKAKKNYRRSSSITQRINFQEDKDDYVLDNSDWAKLNNNLKTPPLELGFIEALSRLLRLAFMFIAGLTYSFIRLPAAVISDVIKNFREQKFSAWLIYFLPNLGRSLFSNIYNTTRNWVKDENELFYKDHYARTREFPENGSALLYFIGFLAGIIISPLYATYFAFIKSPEYDMQNPKHYERHREPFFQTLFKSPFRFIKALFSCPFDLAVKLAVINYNTSDSEENTPSLAKRRLATYNSDPDRSSETKQEQSSSQHQNQGALEWGKLYRQSSKGNQGNYSLTPNPARKSSRSNNP